MKRCPPLRLRTATIAALLLAALSAVSAFGQLQTGNIYGRVQAKDGSLLPGVTVTLSGAVAPQTFITDSTGSFRFINLSPGSYTLKAELAGFGSATRQGVQVRVGGNADVTMNLNPASAESITVTAEAPLLDVRRTGTGATVTKVELEKVPTGRDPWVILQQTPGVLMDRINIGGNESGQQSNYVGKGSTADQSTWNVDGVNITDVGALGSSPAYYDFDSFEEMQVTTGGTDVRIQTPGVQLNMVTKRGTNDVRGSARYYQTNGDLQSDPKIPSEAKTYLEKVNEIDNIDDYGLEAGGPIIHDKLWLWGAYSKQDINLFVSQPAGQTRRYTDKTKLETWNAKLNAQPAVSNSLSVAAMLSDKIKLGRNASPSRPPETTYNQGGNYGGPTMWKVEDTQMFGSNVYLTGLLSHLEGGFQLIADAGKGCKSVDCMLTVGPSYQDADGNFHRNYLSYYTERPQDQYRADGSTFFNTGALSHELKFGFGYRNASVRSQTTFSGKQWIFFSDPLGPGAAGGVEMFRDIDFTYGVKSTDAYVGDTMLMGNLTLQAGLRYDLQKATVNSGSVGANPVIPDVLPAITFNGASAGQLKWDSISPRLGLTYQLGSDKKTLLRAAANRYVDQVGGSTVYFASPLSYSYLYYYFNDLNNDQTVQRNEIDFGTGIAGAYNIDPSKTTVANIINRWDRNMKPPHTDEFLAGFERELMSDLTIGVNATYRKLKDFVAFRNEKHQGAGDFFSSADYVLGGNLTGTLPNGKAYSVPYYRLKPGLDAPLYAVITNRPDYSQTYKGAEINITKRMSNRWMMRGNISLNDWTQEVGPGAFADPGRYRGTTGCTNCDGTTVVYGSGTGSGAKGGVYINAKWAYNLTGVYQVPVIETSVGFNLTGRQGYPIPFVHRTSFITNAGPVSEGRKFVLIPEDPATYRHKDLHNLDLRIAKDIRFGRAGVTFSADVFNVLNANTIMQRDVRRVNASFSNQITELQSPRVIRLGARLIF